MKPWYALALVVATAACDRLATGSFKPPYVTVAGQIDTSTLNVIPGDIRVAIVWQNDDSPGSSYGFQLADVDPQIGTFNVYIDTPPTQQVVLSLQPDTAIGLGVDPGMRWAVGTLVFYSDGNGNGQLDVVSPTDPPSPDRILAATTDLDIWWLGSGKPAASEFVGLFPVESGFSLVHEPMQRDPLPGECGWFDAQGHYSGLCPPLFAGDPSTVDSTSYKERVVLLDDPRLQGFTCSAFYGMLEIPDYTRDPSDICDGGGCRYCRGYQCPLDVPPPGVAVTCSANKLSYVYKTCVDDPASCGTRFCHFGHGERLATDAPPPNWPCP